MLQDLSTAHRVPENKILFKKLKSGLTSAKIVNIQQKTGEHV